jgi:hypothetical protein
LSGISTSTDSLPNDDRAGTDDRVRQHGALVFTAAILFITLALQRFALPLAGRTLSIVTPIGLGFAVIGLAGGALCFHRRRSIAFVILVVLALLGAMGQAIAPDTISDLGFSFNSVLLFLGVTSFATLSFAVPVDEGVFFRRVNFALLLIGIAGICQFFAQIAGLKLFAFTGLLPGDFLNEANYHLEIPVGFGDLLKSNGFLLVEPSVFSQFMALGLIIEFVGTRRLPYIGVFVAALLLSFSGTGWIVLGTFLVVSAATMGGRGVLIACGILLVLGVALGIVLLVAPDAIGALTDRIGEINQPGTSGHMRFITPFWMLSDVFSSRSSAWLFGIGAGRSELLSLPYDYTVNTAIKVVAEYGIPALVVYVSLFVLGRKTPIQVAILLPCLVLFFFTGGYQEFSPILFLVLLLVTVARLQRTEQAGVPAPS